VSKDGVIRFRLQTDSDVDTAAAPTPWGGIVFASGKVLYASRPDGTLLWRFQARRKCYSSPAVADDGTVYLGCQDHFFYAVSPAGKVKWVQIPISDIGSALMPPPSPHEGGPALAGCGV
jgi:outer membrane protein assembly factor BamB